VKRLHALVFASPLLSALLSACVYDGDQRCGPHQRLLSADRCECEAGYVPGAEGCEPCAENEEESAGACVCVAGFARPAEGALCEPIPSELGTACDTEDAPCPGLDYPLCHVTEGTAGYCTSACAEDEACEGGYRCHEDGADSYCRRPPVGYGAACATDDDCAAGEATFCETIRTNQCLVPCSAGHTESCFEGEVCCDFAVFAPICVPAGACTSMSGKELP
jgi:hypothetical protein